MKFLVAERKYWSFRMSLTMAGTITVKSSFSQYFVNRQVCVSLCSFLQNVYQHLPLYAFITAKANWLFKPQRGYPSCRQAKNTLVRLPIANCIRQTLRNRILRPGSCISNNWGRDHICLYQKTYIYNHDLAAICESHHLNICESHQLFISIIFLNCICSDSLTDVHALVVSCKVCLLRLLMQSALIPT